MAKDKDLNSWLREAERLKEEAERNLKKAMRNLNIAMGGLVVAGLCVVIQIVILLAR